MRRSFTVFGEDWGRHPSSTQHIFKHLMKDNDIHWINSIGMRAPKLCIRDIKRVWEKGKSYLHKTKETVKTQDSPITYQPRLLPFHGRKFVQAMNKKLFKHPNTSVLWTSLPTSVYLHDQLNPACTVYYCGDDFGVLEGVDHAMVEVHEKELAERADIIFTINADLASRFPKHKTHILDHGVDYELFSTPQQRPDDLPDKEKIAGFYGSIQSWIDLELIESLAKELSEWTFVFIGNVHVDISKLQAYPNIHFLGSKKHSELPGYVQNWDVSLLPFKKTAQIDACNPLKLKEYMAAGTQIVSTKFPAVEIFDDIIHVTETAQDFLTAVTASPKEGDDQRYVQQCAVKNHSWEARAQYVQNLISSHLMA
jgi:glycosyltransferase involved in cell wall biosynthesis